MAGNVTELNKAEGPTNGEAKLPTREELSSLAREVRDQQATMDEARGEIGAAMKHASEKKNIHKKAFKTCLMILNMDDTKRDEFLTHFDHYREQMGIDEGRTADMFASEDAA